MFFRSGYDHVLLESYLIPHLFETKHKNLLEKVAKDLIEKETIEREEFEKLIKSK